MSYSTEEEWFASPAPEEPLIFKARIIQTTIIV
jgi:hypothetical protein